MGAPVGGGGSERLTGAKKVAPPSVERAMKTAQCPTHSVHTMYTLSPLTAIPSKPAPPLPVEIWTCDPNEAP